MLTFHIFHGSKQQKKKKDKGDLPVFFWMNSCGGIKEASSVVGSGSVSQKYLIWAFCLFVIAFVLLNVCLWIGNVFYI